MAICELLDERFTRIKSERESGDFIPHDDKPAEGSVYNPRRELCERDQYFKDNERGAKVPISYDDGRAV